MIFQIQNSRYMELATTFQDLKKLLSVHLVIFCSSKRVIFNKYLFQILSFLHQTSFKLKINFQREKMRSVWKTKYLQEKIRIKINIKRKMTEFRNLSNRILKEQRKVDLVFVHEL